MIQHNFGLSFKNLVKGFYQQGCSLQPCFLYLLLVVLKYFYLVFSFFLYLQPVIKPMMSSICSVVSSLNTVLNRLWLYAALLVQVMVIWYLAEMRSSASLSNTSFSTRVARGPLPDIGNDQWFFAGGAVCLMVIQYFTGLQCFNALHGAGILAGQLFFYRYFSAYGEIRRDASF